MSESKRRSEARQYRQWIRRQASAARYVPIAIVPGADAPTEQGEPGHYTTPGGRPVRYPNAYRRAWGKPVYHLSSVTVTVGADWLSSRGIPAGVVSL
jgi:hypothetical protein